MRNLLIYLFSFLVVFTACEDDEIFDLNEQLEIERVIRSGEVARLDAEIDASFAELQQIINAVVAEQATINEALASAILSEQAAREAADIALEQANDSLRTDLELEVLNRKNDIARLDISLLATRNEVLLLLAQTADSLQANIEAVDKARLDGDTALANSLSSVMNLQSSNVTLLANQLDALEVKVAEEIARLDGEISRLDGEIEAAEEARDAMQTLLEEKIAAAEAAAIAGDNALKLELQGEIQSLTSSITTVENEIDTLQSEMTTAQTNITTLQGQQSTNAAAIAANLATITSVNSSTLTISSTLASALTDISNLKTQAQESTDFINSLITFNGSVVELGADGTADYEVLARRVLSGSAVKFVNTQGDHLGNLVVYSDNTDRDNNGTDPDGKYSWTYTERNLYGTAPATSRDVTLTANLTAVSDGHVLYVTTSEALDNAQAIVDNTNLIGSVSATLATLDANLSELIGDNTDALNAFKTLVANTYVASNTLDQLVADLVNDNTTATASAVLTLIDDASIDADELADLIDTNDAVRGAIEDFIDYLLSDSSNTNDLKERIVALEDALADIQGFDIILEMDFKLAGVSVGSQTVTLTFDVSKTIEFGETEDDFDGFNVPSGYTLNTSQAEIIENIGGHTGMDLELLDGDGVSGKLVYGNVKLKDDYVLDSQDKSATVDIVVDELPEYSLNLNPGSDTRFADATVTVKEDVETFTVTITTTDAYVFTAQSFDDLQPTFGGDNVIPGVEFGFTTKDGDNSAFLTFTVTDVNWSNVASTWALNMGSYVKLAPVDTDTAVSFDFGDNTSATAQTLTVSATTLEVVVSTDKHYDFDAADAVTAGTISQTGVTYAHGAIADGSTTVTVTFTIGTDFDRTTSAETFAVALATSEITYANKSVSIPVKLTATNTATATIEVQDAGNATFDSQVINLPAGKQISNSGASYITLGDISTDGYNRQIRVVNTASSTIVHVSFASPEKRKDFLAGDLTIDTSTIDISSYVVDVQTDFELGFNVGTGLVKPDAITIADNAVSAEVIIDASYGYEFAYSLVAAESIGTGVTMTYSTNTGQTSVTVTLNFDPQFDYSDQTIDLTGIDEVVAKEFDVPAYFELGGVSLTASQTYSFSVVSTTHVITLSASDVPGYDIQTKGSGFLSSLSDPITVVATSNGTNISITMTYLPVITENFPSDQDEKGYDLTGYVTPKTSTRSIGWTTHSGSNGFNQQNVTLTYGVLPADQTLALPSGYKFSSTGSITHNLDTGDDLVTATISWDADAVFATLSFTSIADTYDFSNSGAFATINLTSHVEEAVSCDSQWASLDIPVQVADPFSHGGRTHAIVKVGAITGLNSGTLKSISIGRNQGNPNNISYTNLNMVNTDGTLSKEYIHITDDNAQSDAARLAAFNSVDGISLTSLPAIATFENGSSDWGSNSNYIRFTFDNDGDCEQSFYLIIDENGVNTSSDDEFTESGFN